MKASKRTEKMFFRCSKEFLELVEILMQKGGSSADALHKAVAGHARTQCHWMPLDKMHLCDIVGDLDTNKRRKEIEKIRNKNKIEDLSVATKQQTTRDLFAEKHSVELKEIYTAEADLLKHIEAGTGCEVCGANGTAKTVIPGHGTYQLCFLHDDLKKFEKGCLVCNKWHLLNRDNPKQPVATPKIKVQLKFKKDDDDSFVKCVDCNDVHTMSERIPCKVAGLNTYHCPKCDCIAHKDVFCQVCGWGDSIKNNVNIPGYGAFTLCRRCDTPDKFKKRVIEFNKTNLLFKNDRLVEGAKKDINDPRKKPVATKNKIYKWNKASVCLNPTTIFKVASTKKSIWPHAEIMIAEYKGKWAWAKHYNFTNGGGGSGVSYKYAKFKTKESCVAAAVADIEKLLKSRRDRVDKKIVRLCNDKLKEFKLKYFSKNNETK